MLTQKQLQLHVPIVAGLMLAQVVILLAVGVFILILLPTIGFSVGDRTALNVLVTVGVSVGCFLSILALPGLIAGIGLLARRPWARILAVIVALLGVLNVPVGTIIGIYTAWVLLQEGASDYFHPQESQEITTAPVV